MKNQYRYFRWGIEDYIWAYNECTDDWFIVGDTKQVVGRPFSLESTEEVFEFWEDCMEELDEDDVFIERI